MPYVMTHFWPGGTEEQYRATVAAVHPSDGLPAGQLEHVAGPTEGGYLVVAVWDTKSSADRFVADGLQAHGPVDGGFAGAPQERNAEVANHVTS